VDAQKNMGNALSVQYFPFYHSTPYRTILVTIIGNILLILVLGKNIFHTGLLIGVSTLLCPYSDENSENALGSTSGFAG
jgi:hypothetical protein